MISDCISDDITPQMENLNRVIPILMLFCSFLSNWSIASRKMLHVIERKVTQLMTSNCFLQYIAGYTVAIFDVIQSEVALKSKCIRIIFIQQILSGTLSECQVVVIQIRAGVVSVLRSGSKLFAKVISR